MVTVKQLDSIYNTPDGKKILVNVFNWGNIALSGDELAEYEIDKKSMTEYYYDHIEKGIFTLSPVKETVTTSSGDTMDLRIGYIYILPEDYVQHPKYEYWNLKFQSDPNVEFYPEEIIG
jgi:hypothetical protein